MIRIAPSAFLALFLVPLAALAGSGKDKVKAGSVDEQFLALRKEYQLAIKGVDGDDKKHKISAAFAPRFLALAERNAKDEAAADALLWILINAPQAPEMRNAVNLLEKQYLQSPRLKVKMLPLHSADAPEVERFLRAVLEKNQDKDTRGLACLSLAQMLHDKAGDDNQKLRKEAIGMLDLCVAKYADCPAGNKEPSVGERAKPLLFDMRFLAIGKIVPDISGEDLDGKSFKLSDYRGKVVMLSFWATWCPYCMKLVPHEKALVKRLEGKPFVLVGVNGDRNDEKKNVKLRIEKEQIPWRSFWNGGPIAAKWNVEYWPRIFIIDHNGVIRHRLGGASDEELKAAIDPLIAAAKKGKGKTAPAK
jgi:thiol-disulfide isomerase/thioredoxin